jgi:ribosomal protein S24E
MSISDKKKRKGREISNKYTFLISDEPRHWVMEQEWMVERTIHDQQEQTNRKHTKSANGVGIWFSSLFYQTK